MYQNIIKSLDLTNNTYNEKNTSITGRTFVADFGNNYWTFRIKTVPMSRADFADKFFKTNVNGNGLFYSFTGSQVGRINTAIQIPVLNDSAGTVSGSAVTSGGVWASGANDVGSDFLHFQADTGATVPSGTLKAGDLIQFNNHAKVYMVTADITFDTVNSAALNRVELTPRLIKNVASATMSYDSITFSAIPDGDVLSWQIGREELYEFDATYREVF